MSVVGAILWLANVTRPELSYAAAQLARFVANPGRVHYDAAMRVLVYLGGSVERDLVLAPDTSLPLMVYADSDWSVQFSVSGWIAYFFGCPIAWASKTQTSVSLSSAESEIFGAMMAARDGLFLRDLLADLGLLQAGPTVLYLDSKSAIDLAFDPVAFKRTKHVMRATHFLRDLVARRFFVPRHVAGTSNPADVFTKSLGRATFVAVLRLLREPPRP